MAKDIKITDDIIAKYDTKDIIHYLAVEQIRSLKALEGAIIENNWGMIGGAATAIELNTKILAKLDDKLNSNSRLNVV